MDDDAKVEIMWQERTENTTKLEAIREDIQSIKILLATAQGGGKALGIVGVLAGAVIGWLISLYAK